MGWRRRYSRNPRGYLNRYARSTKIVKTRLYGRSKKSQLTNRSLFALPLVFPDKYVCKLRYCTEVTIDPGNTGTVTSVVFRANGLYDPEVAIGGHQPMGFDSLMTLYNHFCVLGSKITVRLLANNTSNTNEGQWGMTLTDSGTITSGLSVSNCMELDKSKRGYRNYGITNAYASKMDTHCTKTFSAKKFFGVPRILAQEEDYQGSSTGDPQELAYFELWAGSLDDGSIDPAKQYFAVTIEYIAKFTEPKNLAQS